MMTEFQAKASQHLVVRPDVRDVTRRVLFQLRQASDDRQHDDSDVGIGTPKSCAKSREAVRKLSRRGVNLGQRISSSPVGASRRTPSDDGVAQHTGESTKIHDPTFPERNHAWCAVDDTDLQYENVGTLQFDMFVKIVPNQTGDAA